VKGLYFEQFEVGQVFETGGRTITEAAVDTFAGVTGDLNPLHTDEQYAIGTRWGTRIVHGLLGLSVSMGLFSRLGVLEGTAEAFLAMDMQFRDVIRIGDTIRLVASVKKKRDLRGPAGTVTFESVIYNQHDKAVQRGIWSAMVLKKAPEPHAATTHALHHSERSSS
jgi:acyl dehydratase